MNDATILVLGSGAREQALARALASSPSVARVVVAPGNGGAAERVAMDLAEPEDVVRVARRARFHDEVAVATQAELDQPALSLAEIDRLLRADALWDKLAAGGSVQQCGWLKDRYGLSWQIVPERLLECVNDPDEAAATPFWSVTAQRPLSVAAAAIWPPDRHRAGSSAFRSLPPNGRAPPLRA